MKKSAAAFGVVLATFALALVGKADIAVPGQPYHPHRPPKHWPSPSPTRPKASPSTSLSPTDSSSNEPIPVGAGLAVTAAAISSLVGIVLIRRQG